jgi:uroporphyrinogen-III synthase
VTAIRTPTILITRPAQQAAALAGELQIRGFETFSEPMLEIRPVSHQLPKDVQADALIFTSARAAAYWQDIPPELLQKPVYTVGEKTAAALKKKGFRNIAATAASATALEAVFKRESAQNSLPENMLHICGRDRAHHFDVKNTKITTFTVYSAVRAENFTKNLQSLLHNEKIACVLFYSVRTAENFIRLSKNYELTEKYGQITAICISTRTAQAIKDVQWGNVLTAEKPDHAHMLHCIEQQFR